MKIFNVIFLKEGLRKSTFIEAKNKKELIQIFKSTSPQSIILSINEKKWTLQTQYKPFKRLVGSFFRQKIPLKEKIVVMQQIAVMSDAGISFHLILEEVSKGITHPRLHTIYKEVARSIHVGHSFYDALKPYQEELGTVVLAMTKLGEKTGNMSDAYKELTSMLETMQQHQNRFKKSLRASFITLSAMIVAFFVLILLVVPKFTEIFARFKGELPLPTQILLWLEHMIQHYGLLGLGTLSIILFILRSRYRYSSVCRYRIDTIFVHRHFYFIHKMIFSATLYQYHLILASLLKSGVTLLDALDISVDMVNNQFLKQKLNAVNIHISKGMPLTQAYKLTGLYPNILLQIINVGEKSAKLKEMLQKTTEYYKQDLEKHIENVNTYLEPLLMFFISLLVLFMALGIFMPMWELSSLMR